MKSSMRRTIAVVAVILIAILLWLWLRGEEPKPPVGGEVVAKPEPKPEPTPEPAPKPVAPEPLSATVLFNYDRAEIRPSEATALDALAENLQGRVLEIVGHADRIGSDRYNLALSQRRAAAVRDYLAGKGVAAGSMRVQAVGEAEPVTGDTCNALGPTHRRNRKLIECLQPNRRVELKVPG